MPSLDSFKIEEGLGSPLYVNGLPVGHPIGFAADPPPLYELTAERLRTLRVQCIESPCDSGESSVGAHLFSRISRMLTNSFCHPYLPAPSGRGGSGI